MNNGPFIISVFKSELKLQYLFILSLYLKKFFFALFLCFCYVIIPFRGEIPEPTSLLSLSYSLNG